MSVRELGKGGGGTQSGEKMESRQYVPTSSTCSLGYGANL